MNRIVVILIALAALTAVCASGTEVSAKTHRKSPASTYVRAIHRRTTTHRAHRSVDARTEHRRAEKLTPEEVGHAAGLAIRNGREQGRPTRRNLVYRRRSSRSNLRPVSFRRPYRTVRVSGHPIEAAPAVASRTSDRGQVERAEVATMEHPVAAQAVASDVPEAADETPDPGPATETEQASLDISRGAMPRPLYGTVASLDRQNARLEAEGLERIEDESDLEARIASGLLVRVPVSDALTLNEDLPETHRYCRPWTARFLKDLAREHEVVFHKPLEVSSAVRTVEYQRRLMATNGNAAPARGDIVSPHLTGATVDIAKKGMNRKEIAWMRRRLLATEDTGKIDVEEEFYQACFHITVYENYVPTRTLHSPSRATSPASRPRREPEPSEANTDAAAATGF